jgi:hypothetical protein
MSGLLESYAHRLELDGECGISKIGRLLQFILPSSVIAAVIIVKTFTPICPSLICACDAVPLNA